MKIRKLEYYDKINLTPELMTYYHPRGELQVALRSPKFLKHVEEDEYIVYHIQASKYATLVNPDAIYDTIKIMIKSVTELYYDCLQETEMYAFPEELKNSKTLDKVMIVQETE